MKLIMQANLIPFPDVKYSFRLVNNFNLYKTKEGRYYPLDRNITNHKIIKRF